MSAKRRPEAAWGASLVNLLKQYIEFIDRLQRVHSLRYSTHHIIASYSKPSPRQGVVTDHPLLAILSDTRRNSFFGFYHW